MWNVYNFIYIYEEGVVKTRNLLGEGVIEVIIFDLVFIKKNNEIEFILKKIETVVKPVQTDQFRFGFLG
jgi:hypothetical protein